jgi:probable tail fiber protein|nr:MAG TPA: tail fiber repeat protein [Caudoviricetes sp.]
MKTLLPEINSADKRFHAGNPATGEQGTRVTDTWLNDVQDRVRDVQAEAHYVLQKAGFTPKAETQTQLYQAIVKIIDDNRKSASTTQKGEVQLYSGYDSESEEMAATPKVIKILKGFIDSVVRSLTNYIPNSKKSSAVNSNSSDTVATSAAVKMANDNANDRVAKSGDTMTGNLSLKQGNYSGLNVYNNDGYYTRLEGNPHNANNLLTFVYRTPQGANIASVGFPKKNGTIAYIDDVVLKSGDSMTGILYSVGISSKHYGYGAYDHQYTSGAPFLVNAEGSQNRDTYHPFVKGLVRSKGRYGAGFSFGYTTKQGAGDGFGRGIINLIEDNGTSKNWGFEHNGDFYSAGDIRTSSGKSLNTAVQLSDYRSQWGQTGWVKLPNGLILQWGKTPVIHDENSTDIVFPIAFPNKVLNIQLTENQMRTVAAHATHLAALNVTNSKFTFKINSTLPIDSSADWFAIGY